MSERFLCITCEKESASVDSIKGFTSFFDIRRDLDKYIERLLDEGISCDFCGLPVNNQTFSESEVIELFAQGKIDADDLEDVLGKPQ